MALDIFAPEISEVVKGIGGKTILIYGGNRCGKTSNAVKSDRPLVVAFEQGLNALRGIPYLKPKKWTDWVSIVNQFKKEANLEQVRSSYGTIIIDTVERMTEMAEAYVKDSNQVQALADIPYGGGWAQLRDEIKKTVNSLTAIGLTVVFIAHDDPRTLMADDGKEYTKLFPRGDKKSVDFICDLVDIIAYVATPASTDGEDTKAAMYLHDSIAYKAGGRFSYLPKVIPEWDMKKLEKAIDDAIAKGEEDSGIAAISLEEKLKKDDVENKLDDLIETIGIKAQVMAETNEFDKYLDIVVQATGDPDFKASKATEKDIKKLEKLLAALEKAGF